jgi:hypothetical protein
MLVRDTSIYIYGVRGVMHGRNIIYSLLAQWDHVRL